MLKMNSQDKNHLTIIISIYRLVHQGQRRDKADVHKVEVTCLVLNMRSKHLCAKVFVTKMC